MRGDSARAGEAAKATPTNAIIATTAVNLPRHRRPMINNNPRNPTNHALEVDELAVRAVGAAASRSAQYVELMGCVDVPPGCDMLAGTCLMAGPVNQNDIGKEFFGIPDLLEETFGDRDPTSLLVWTLKAKTVADPIGNEEQLLDRRRRGPLVDLRGGPHDLVSVRRDGQVRPMRRREGRTNVERAFADAGNFAVDPEGREIPGNRGAPWPLRWRHEPVWDAEPTADLEPA